GMIRSRVEAVPAPYRADWYETGGAFGGGLAVFTAARVGVRGDVRYIQAFSGGLNYWRTSVGVVFRCADVSARRLRTSPTTRPRRAAAPTPRQEDRKGIRGPAGKAEGEPR